MIGSGSEHSLIGTHMNVTVHKALGGLSHLTLRL